MGVTASFILFVLFSRSVEEKSQAQFEYRAQNAQLAIQTRVRSYIDVLRGAAALFATVDEVTREQFHDYISQLKLERSFPGITNLNYAQYVNARDKEAFEMQVRRDTSLLPKGYPDFAIKPPGNRAGYHVLTYLEPFESNLISFGFDISSNEVGTKALELSRDSGQLFSSGKLIRISGPNKHIGLAMRMPLYRRGMPADTVEQRRAAYFGSVGAGFDVEKLMRGAVDKQTLSNMRIRVYDVGGYEQKGDERKGDTLSATADNMLFDSAMQPDGNPIVLDELSRDVFLKRTTMTVGPRVWELEFTAYKSVMTSGISFCRRML